MRRSGQVVAPLVASAALAMLTACRQGPEMQRCVDEHNVVVADSFCKNLPATQGVVSQPGSSMGMLPLIIPYRYYYGGYGGYGLGSTVGGGGFAPSSGHSYSTTTGTSRGGFGSSFGGGGHGSAS